ncbi:MAG: archaetidylinositol phosphate synthase [Methanobacteriaceae archaeon]|nr:archaetidylinositol phosphate synthase [Methanobacteriaceae archaeon]
MLNQLRPYLRSFLNPIARKIPLNPNIITIIGLIISLIASYMFATQDLIWGAILIILSGFMDVIDGAVARNNYSPTKFGGILDSTTDRFADAFILIGLIYGGYSNWIIGILALHASLTVSYVRARAEVEGIKCDVGIAERAERIFIILAGVILTLILKTNLIEIAVIIVMILGYFTVIQRVYHSWMQLKKKRI